MDAPSVDRPRPAIRFTAGRVVLAYAAVSALWILLSDLVVGGGTGLVLAHTAKGLAFVAVTSLLLYALLRRLLADEARAREESAQAHMLLEAVAKGSTDAIFAKDLEGRYLLCNEAAGRYLGGSPGEALGRDDRALMPVADAARIRENDAAVLAEARVITFEERIGTAVGPVHFLATKGPLRDEGGRLIGLFGISRDITSLKRIEESLRRANRALRTLMECGQAFTRTSTEQKLLDAMCERLAASGGFPLVWVGLAGPGPECRVLPVARAGRGVAYLDELTITWSDGPAGRGPTGTAVREERVVVARCIREESAMMPWRERALAFGFASSISLPLAGAGGDGRPGALTLYSDQPDAFDRDEQALLTRLADELAFGIRSRRDAIARRETEARLGDIQAREREREASALRESEERYRRLFEANEAAMLLIDAGTLRIVAANAAAARFYGWDRYRLEEMRLEELNTAPPEEIRAVVDRARASGSMRLEVSHRRADGVVRDVEVFTGPVRFGERTLMHAIVHDVTDSRRDAEQAQRWQRVFEKANFALAHHRAADNTFIEVNASFAAQRGYSPRELRGRPILCIYPPEDHGHILGRFAEADAHGHLAFEATHLRRDGTRFPVLLEVTVIPGRDGLPATRITHAIDMSERKSAEEQVRKLSLAVEQSLESVVITNLRAEIEYVNETFVRTTGYAREEVLGRNPRILHSGKTRPEAYGAMWSALQAGEPWRGEFVNRRKDGTEYIEFATVSPIRDTAGRVTHYLAVKEDITERKRLGRELDRYRHHLEELVSVRTAELAEARERAEEANRAKSAFLANMSHEIRTPMNAIVGLTHLMRRSGVTPEQGRRLEKIDSAGRHLLAIINDILDLSKIEAGRMALEEEDFHLQAILDNIRSIVASQAEAKGLSIVMDAGTVPAWLRGDPTRLRQALLNYAANAVKFTERGQVVLRARLLAQEGEWLHVRFEVEDTGIGIEAAKIPTLFRAFEQADVSTTRQYGGTGLGLAITRRLAELMGGEVGVQSTPGRGSTFWFTARLGRGRGAVPAAAPARAGEAETRLRLRHAGARVLLAEDNAVNREVALELLSAVGLAVDTAEDGRQAVAMAGRGHYDLVLMDVQMPVLDGLAATRAIRQLPGREHLPILAMTANAFEEDRRACEAAGMSDFVAKPVDPLILYGRLDRWLPSHAREGPSGEAPSAVPPPMEPEPSGPDAAAVAATIASLAARGDTEAIAWLDLHEDKLRAAFGPRLAPLADALRRYDFDAALDAAKELRA